MNFRPQGPNPFDSFARSGVPLGSQAPLWKKIVAALVTAVLFGVALMFSVVFFAAVLTLGLGAWGWLWWKTRAIRKQMRDNPPGGLVLEGEVIREVKEER